MLIKSRVGMMKLVMRVLIVCVACWLVLSIVTALINFFMAHIVTFFLILFLVIVYRVIT